MADTGWKSPGTATNDNAVGTESWANPDNIKSSDNSYAILEPESSGTPIDKVVKLVDSDGDVVGDNNADEDEWTSSEIEVTYGGSSDKWGETWSVSDINDSNFGVVLQITESLYPSYSSNYLKATNFGFEIPSGATIDGIEVVIERNYISIMFLDAHVNHIKMKVYYTEATSDTSKFFQLF
jgi:hypothetical protein